ncbi:MAG: hypothetical protein AABY66_05500, partial [Nitrospirota bacterium]
ELVIEPPPAVHAGPLSLVLVTVCAIVSLFFHVTVSPTKIVTLSGKYAVVQAEDAPEMIEMVVAVPLLLLPPPPAPPQPVINKETANKQKILME